jgi:hypothetical protein
MGLLGMQELMVRIPNRNPNCDTSGDFFHVGYPGIPDLSVTPVNGPEGSTRNFEDRLSSYFCVGDA